MCVPTTIFVPIRFPFDPFQDPFQTGSLEGTQRHGTQVFGTRWVAWDGPSTTCRGLGPGSIMQCQAFAWKNAAVECRKEACGDSTEVRNCGGRKEGRGGRSYLCSSVHARRCTPLKRRDGATPSSDSALPHVRTRLVQRGHGHAYTSSPSNLAIPLGLRCARFGGVIPWSLLAPPLSVPRTFHCCGPRC